MDLLQHRLHVIVACCWLLSCPLHPLLHLLTKLYYLLMNIWRKEQGASAQCILIRPAAAAGFRQARDAASVDSLAWPDLNVQLGPSPPPDMVAQGSSWLGHKDPLHILLYPVHCERPALRHMAPVPASGLNTSPVTGWSQCQFSCLKNSGVQAHCKKSYTYTKKGTTSHKGCKSNMSKVSF